MEILRLCLSKMIVKAQCSSMDRVAQCEAPLFDYAVKRADPQDLRTVFFKYASVEENGERYMKPADLIRDLLQMDAASFDADTLKLMSGVVDLTKDGLISFEEFQAFEALLCEVDAKYKVAFQMFDLDGKGTITFDEFKSIMEIVTTARKFPFNFDSDFCANYFGVDRKREITYPEFTQLIQDLNREYLQQSYKRRALADGSISALHFAEIMRTVSGHKMTPYIAENMIAAVGMHSASRRVSFIYCISFNSLLDNLSTITEIFNDITDRNKFTLLTKEELLQGALKYPHVTPMQVDILFDLLTVSSPGIGKISLLDTLKLHPKPNPMTVFSKIHEFKRYGDPEKGVEKKKQGVLLQTAESAYRFLLGSVAGAAGATAVYPIDLVKTRMQNQRTILASERLYKNSWDCARKVLKAEGPRGLYRGLLPQVIGVSPEKAIKLTTNDFVRGKFTDKDGEIRVIGEILAGGCGGGAQVLFTNPIEIVKIRMQVAGESGQYASAIVVAKELGLGGLYKGARACFLRDIPFSAIYFPCYAHFKTSSADRNGYNTPLSLLGSAAAAGVPAAYLVTPADVIKTRIQVKARQGQQTYRGVVDCFRKVYAEEGWTAFWKGGPARIFRSSPQFGVTLLVYEMLQRYFYVDFGGGYTKTQITPQNPEVSLHPDHIGGLRLAVSSYSGIETKFGLFLPKFSPAPNMPISALPTQSSTRYASSDATSSASGGEIHAST